MPKTSTENRLKKQGLLSLGHFGCFVCNQTLPKQQATLGLLQFNGVHLKIFATPMLTFKSKYTVPVFRLLFSSIPVASSASSTASASRPQPGYFYGGWITDGIVGPW